MSGWWWAVFLVLVGAGITAGLAAVLSPQRIPPAAAVLDPLVPRVRVRVRVGREQIVIRLGRALGVAQRREDVGYGELYIAESSVAHIVIASRSEIGRSFEGEVQLRSLTSSTVVEYYVHALPPGGPELEGAVQRLEGELLRALRQMGPALEPLSTDRFEGRAPTRPLARLRAGAQEAG